MYDLILGTAQSLDRQLAGLAVQIAGNPNEARDLLRAVARREETPLVSAFLNEGGALLRARRLLTEAIDDYQLTS